MIFFSIFDQVFSFKSLFNCFFFANRGFWNWVVRVLQTPSKVQFTFNAFGWLIISPLEQFEINTNKGLKYTMDYSTDVKLFYSTFWNFIASSSIQEVTLCFVFFVVYFSYFFFFSIKFYPYQWVQIFVENYIVTIRNFVIQNAGFGNQPMTIFFITLSTALLIFNISGMIPFAFTLTSHFVTTFFYSFSLFFGINFIAINRHGKNFFNIFLPQGTPLALLPLLVGLEFISYSSRLFSLSIRLFANIMAGHALLNIFTSFAFKAIQFGGLPFIVSFVGIILLFAIIFMEVAIAVLQVFVFITLSALYIVDVHSVNH